MLNTREPLATYKLIITSLNIWKWLNFLLFIRKYPHVLPIAVNYYLTCTTCTSPNKPLLLTCLSLTQTLYRGYKLLDYRF